jgi:hypothetical protein
MTAARIMPKVEEFYIIGNIQLPQTHIYIHLDSKSSYEREI